MEDVILNQFCIGEEFALYEFELEYLETKTDKMELIMTTIGLKETT